MDNETVTLDAQTAAEIREYLKGRESFYTSHHLSDYRRQIFRSWIAALKPKEKIVPDGPFDEYYNGGEYSE